MEEFVLVWRIRMNYFAFGHAAAYLMSSEGDYDIEQPLYAALHGIFYFTDGILLVRRIGMNDFAFAYQHHSLFYSITSLPFLSFLLPSLLPYLMLVQMG